MLYKDFSTAYTAKYGSSRALLNLVFSAVCEASMIASSGACSGAGAGAVQISGQLASSETCNTLPVIGWSCFNRENLQTLKRLATSEAGICQNSASQYLARIKTILTEARDEGVTEVCADYQKILSVRQFRSHGVYLDNDKLHELELWQPEAARKDLTATMRITKLLALISARTGARASDVVRFSPSNIRNGLLTYVPKKTKDTSGKICVVPVGPKTIGWIKEVAELTKDIDTSTEKAEKAFYVRYERTLKAIMSALPWDEEVIIFAQNKEQVKRFRDCVTSHTLRHSFATNMYLDDEVGGDVYAIAQMLGHSSVDMTMSYIAVPFNEKKMCKVKYFE